MLVTKNNTSINNVSVNEFFKIFKKNYLNFVHRT